MTNIASKLSLQIFLKFEIYLILILPIALITGPAIPDIIITLLAISYLFKKNFLKKIYEFKEINVLSLMFLSMLFTYSINFNLLDFINTFIFIRFFLFIFNACEIFQSNKKIFIYFLNIFLFTYFFEIIDVVIQYFRQYDLFGFPSVYFEDLNLYRLSGTFGDELVVGSYLCKSLPIVIYALFSNYKLNKYLILLITIISIGVIYLTAERGPLLLSLIFFFLICYVLIEKKFMTLSVIIFLFIFYFIIQSNFLLINNIISYLANFQESSYYDLYKKSILVFGENPFLGGGHRAFENLCPKLINFDNNISFDQCSTHPHNYYLEVLNSYGLKSVIFLILFYLLIVYKFFMLEYKKQDKLLISGVIVVFFPLATSSSLFNNNWNMCVIATLLMVFQKVINENKV